MQNITRLTKVIFERIYFIDKNKLEDLIFSLDMSSDKNLLEDIHTLLSKLKADKSIF